MFAWERQLFIALDLMIVRPGWAVSSGGTGHNNFWQHIQTQGLECMPPNKGVLARGTTAVIR